MKRKNIFEHFVFMLDNGKFFSFINDNFSKLKNALLQDTLHCCVDSVSRLTHNVADKMPENAFAKMYFIAVSQIIKRKFQFQLYIKVG